MIDGQSVNQRVAQFDRENGDSIVHNGYVYFANGACRELNPLGLLQSPPRDPWARAKAALIYFQLKSEIAAKAFSRRQHELKCMLHAFLNSPGRVPPPKNQAQTVAELEALRDEARECHKAYQRALDAVEAAKPEAMKNRETEDQNNRRGLESMLSEVELIDL